MHLSLWLSESREFVQQWSVRKFPKISDEALNSWMNLHLFALDRHSHIVCVDSDELIVSSSECAPHLFLLLLTAVKDDHKPPRTVLNCVLTFAQCIMSMFGVMGEYKTAAECRKGVSACSWALMQLLEACARPIGQLPWCIISQTPQIVLAYSTPLLQTCLCDSLPSPLACLVSRERQLASTPSWNNLSNNERICLTTLSRNHSNISDCLIRLPSLNDQALYRLVQVELIRDVALLILCGSQLSLAEIRDKITKYWTPLVDDLSSFQSQNLLYASVEGIPVSLRSFFLYQKEKNQCVQGFMRYDVSLDEKIEHSLKKLFLRFKESETSSVIHTSCFSIVDKSINVTFVVHQPMEESKILVLSFDGQINNNEVRQLALQVDAKLNHWLQTGCHI